MKPIDSSLVLKSLVEQVADLLRHRLKAGCWRNVLPPERSLCRQVQVSRPILRKALHRLEEEKLIRITTGHPARILVPRHETRSAPSSSLVVMLCARPRSSLERWLALTIDELHRLLDARGYQFEFLCNQRLRWKRPAPVLKNIVQQYPANCWVLASQSAAVQHWFQKQRLNAILFGTPYPGIRFSSIDDDNRAICRHAAGIFLGLGHRQVVYFSRQIGGAGVLAGEDGFLEAFQSKVAGAASPLVIRHDGSVERLRAGFQKICRLRPRPTALLVSSAEDALTLFSLALHLGFRIPRDFSLISCGDDQLQRIVPTIACYQMEAEKNALLITRLIGAELISNSSPRHFRIFPKFWRGETLARPM